ncbi:MAG: hypothetical protein KGI25_06320 [Thaumarchaeota archaeon]|nr:hypothetical protein [Nitrososphaerota archaeon]
MLIKTKVTMFLKGGLAKLPRFTDIVKSWKVRKDGPLAVIIPYAIRKELGIESGTKFQVSYDKKKRLIFEKVKP